MWAAYAAIYSYLSAVVWVGFSESDSAIITATHFALMPIAMFLFVNEAHGKHRE